MDLSRTPGLNLANLIGFIVNAAVFGGVGFLGLFGAFTLRQELWDYDESLLTPDGWSFSIWIVIYVSQAIWAVRQLHADSSSVGYSYLGVCVFSSVWTFSFGWEIIVLSMIASVWILVFLVRIVVTQHKQMKEPTRREYFLMQFPFSIHLGWMIAMTLLNLSVLLVWLEVSAAVQYGVALASLVILAIAAALALVLGRRRPELVIGFALAWATLGIFVELAYPHYLVRVTFTNYQIATTRVGAGIASLVIFLSTMYCAYQQLRQAGILRRRKRQTRPKQKEEKQQLTADGDYYLASDDIEK